MPEFIPTLIAALLLLTGLLLVFGGYLVTGPSQPSISSRSEIILLGQDFTVSYGKGEENIGNITGKVSRGLISEIDKSISFDVSRVSDVTAGRITFKILDTNLYGKLEIFVNGNNIYSDYPRIGEHSIDFGKILLKAKDNVIEIRTSSSGWRFWAPSIYEIESYIYLDYGGYKPRVFYFDLNETDINRAVLSIDASGTGRRLGTHINDYGIYLGYGDAYDDISINVFRYGSNKVEFFTESNSYYEVKKAELMIWY